MLAEYGDFLRSLVQLSGARPLRVAVDAGNGMAGHTTPAVLGAIPSITLAPLYFELTVIFPTTRPTRSMPKIYVICRRSSPRRAPISVWPLTATRTGALWSTSVVGRYRLRR